MNKALRWFLALGLLLAILLAAYGSPTWADQSSSRTGVSQALPGQSGAPGSTYKGTVKPPPPDAEACGPGEYPVGGSALVKVHRLTDGYCLAANLRPPFASGRLPAGAGKFLGKVIFIRYFKNGNMEYELPSESGDVEVCFAVPPDTQAQIYFYDFYGPQFGKRKGQPDWVLVESTVEGNFVCAPAMTSGAYGIVGQ